MWGAAAITPVGAPKKRHVSVLEDGREETGLLGWESSRVTGDCGEGELGLALVESLIDGEDGVIAAASLGVKLVSAGLEQYCSTHEVCKLTESHLLSSSFSNTSSASITNHQLSFCVDGLLQTFLLILRPSILQKREMVFVVMCFIVPHILRVPSTVTLGPFLTIAC